MTTFHDDEKLAAYALGELDKTERAEVEAYINQNQFAQDIVAEFSAAARLAADAFQDATAYRGARVALSDAQRQQIREQARNASTPQGGRKRRNIVLWAVGLTAMAAILLIVIGIPQIRRTGTRSGSESAAPETAGRLLVSHQSPVATSAMPAEELLKKQREDALNAIMNEKKQHLSSTSDGTGAGKPAGGVAAHQGSQVGRATLPASGTSLPGKTDPKTSANTPGNQTKLSETSIYSMLTSAQASIERGEYDNAVKILKLALQTDPQNQDLYQSLAGVYRRLGKLSDELQTYADWSNNAPDKPFPHYEEARILAQMGQGPAALDQLKQFVDTNPGDMNTFPMVATIYRSLGMTAEEGTALQVWGQQAPDCIDCQRVLADYYSRTGDLQAALATYQGISQSLPDDADAHRNLANAYRRLNMNEQAQTELLAAAQLQPLNMTTQLQLGDIYRQNQNFDAAIQTYSNIVAHSPNTPEAQQAQQQITQIQQQVQRTTPQR